MIPVLRATLARQRRLVGFVIAINGKTHVADSFGNPLLYAQLEDKLLSAYILEGIEHQIDPNAPAYDKSTASKFFKGAQKVPKGAYKKSAGTRNYLKRKKGMVGNETVDEESGQVLRETYLAQ